jgi:SEC-C motif
VPGPSSLAAPGPTKPEPWYKRNGGARLAQDRAVVAARYPDLTFRVDEGAEQVFVEGSLTLRGESGVPERIGVCAAFPPGYPGAEPEVFDVGDRFPHILDRHFFPDGKCCLWLPPTSRWNGADPEGLGAFLEEVAIFFDKQLTCDVVGYFPGAQWGHGTAGYIEFVRELMGGNEQLLTAFTPVFAGILTPGRNSPCPCGSGRKYKRCHLDFAQRIVEQVGKDLLQLVFKSYLADLIGAGLLPNRIGRHLLLQRRS